MVVAKSAVRAGVPAHMSMIVMGSDIASRSGDGVDVDGGRGDVGGCGGDVVYGGARSVVVRNLTGAGCEPKKKKNAGTTN